MPKTTPARTAVPVILLGKGWYRTVKAAGYRTDAELAVAMRVDPSTVFRVQKSNTPSAPFIAAALDLLGPEKFYDLFEVVSTTHTRRAA